MLGCGQDQGRVQLVNRHVGAAWGGQRPFAPRQRVRRVGQDAQMAGGRLCRLVKPHPQPMTGKDRDRWIVGGIDHVHPHPQNLGEEGQILAQVGRRQQHFGTNFGHCGFPSGG